MDTTPLGEGGKHGSSVNGKGGSVGRFWYLLFDRPANRPDWSRSGFLSEIDVYATGKKLEEIRRVGRGADHGVQELNLGEIHLKRPLKEENPFFLASPKLYEFGDMGGTFPPVGRLDGDQGGVWCHLIKLLNKFGFEVLEKDQSPWRLVGPSRFEHQFASATFHFDRPGLRATRVDFVPEDEAGLFSLLTLHNDTDQPRSVTVKFSGEVNLRPSYESGLPNGPDEVVYRDGLVEGSDSKRASEWGVYLGRIDRQWTIR